MTQTSKVLEHLTKYGTITCRDMALPPFNINCPHDVIRKLRNKCIGITDEWITKKRKVIINGKEANETERYKKYYLEKFGL